MALPIHLPGQASHQPTPAELAPILLEEARRRKVAITTTFVAIALLALLAGLVLVPKNYTSSVTILAQQSDIIEPLLEGRAVPTGVSDRAGMARQVIYSRKVMNEVLAAGGWLDGDPSPRAREALVEDLQGRINITSPRQDLVTIAYTDNDPTRAFEVTERLGELFMEETLAAKERESREAFEFIEARVADYHTKLVSAEQALQDYRSRNADAQPGSVADTTSRISSLRGQLEQARMALIEAQSRVDLLQSQLSGESSVTAVMTRESLYRAQLQELQSQLDTLLLTYTEQYPDVVRIRHQIADIQRSMEEQAQDPSPLGSAFGSTAQLNPHFQELRTQLSEAQRVSASTASRVGMLENLLAAELERSGRIAASESALAELTRDYEVNREIHQDLLRRRENARVSMDLDREQRGLTLRVQDPAVMPVQPSGLRLMHIVAGGLAAAIALPLGLLFLVVRFDPRARSVAQLEHGLSLPILTEIPPYRTAVDRRREWFSTAMCALAVGAVAVLYTGVFVMKQLAL